MKTIEAATQYASTTPAALRRMFRGSRLTRTNGKQIEYSVDGGPITERAARELLSHALCRPDDIGLIANTPQSWRFDTPRQLDDASAGHARTG